MKHTITNEQIDQMKKLKVEGKGTYQIAKQLGLTYMNVAYYTDNYKDKIAKSNKARSMLERARKIATEQYGGGIDVSALSDKPTMIEEAERWEFKIAIGEKEPREEKYLNLFKHKSKYVFEIVDKE